MKPKSNLKWLLIVLAAVIIGAGLYYYFGIVRGSKTAPTASPTPTLASSILISPLKPSPTGSPSAPVNPSPTPSATPSRPALPSGWLDKDAIVSCPGPCNSEFSIYVKNTWTEHTNNVNHTPVFFTDNNQCMLSPDILNTTQCYDDVAVSLSDPGNASLVTRSYPLTNIYNGQPAAQYPKIYVSVNKSVSSADQTLIFESFRLK